MPYIEWTEAISVQDPVLDAQHQQIFSIINELYDALQSGGGVASVELRHILSRLKFFTLTHLQCEEAYIKCAGCPFYEEHRKGHKDMAGRVNDFIAEFDQEQLDAMELLRYLREWWLRHVTKADKEYVSYLPRIGKTKC